MPVVTLVCERCGTPFEGYHNRKYCNMCGYLAQREANRKYHARMKETAEKLREGTPLAEAPPPDDGRGELYVSEWQIRRHVEHSKSLVGLDIPDEVDLAEESSVLDWLHSLDPFKDECPVCYKSKKKQEAS